MKFLFACGIAAPVLFVFIVSKFESKKSFNRELEILLFVIGVLLILVEIFVIPGFGITGITGIVLVILGLSLSLLNNVNFDDLI